jgi:hypothetical protein
MLIYVSRIARAFWFWALLLLGAPACVLAIALFSATYQSCVADENARHASQKQQGALGRVGVLIRCEAAPLDKHAGSLTALGTFAVAVFTLTLWRVTDRTLRLSRDEFNATHRPKIVIHSVKYVPKRDPSGDEAKDEIGARVTFYNKGRSDAKITRIIYSIRQRRLPLDSEIPLPEEAAPRHVIIESGKGDIIECTSEIEIRAAREASRDMPTVLIVRILYEDGRELLRQTGFCRQLIRSAHGYAWERIKGELEYEYSY